MFAKLTALLLMLLMLSAEAQVEPMQFKDLASAKTWFSKSYPFYKFKKEIIKAKNQEIEIIAFYGPKGSGVIRMDGWFYSCWKETVCELVAMMDLGESNQQKAMPKITFEAPNLVINSDGRSVLKIKIIDK